MGSIATPRNAWGCGCARLSLQFTAGSQRDRPLRGIWSCCAYRRNTIGSIPGRRLAIVSSTARHSARTHRRNPFTATFETATTFSEEEHKHSAKKTIVISVPNRTDSWSCGSVGFNEEPIFDHTSWAMTPNPCSFLTRYQIMIAVWLFTVRRLVEGEQCIIIEITSM